MRLHNIINYDDFIYIHKLILGSFGYTPLQVSLKIFSPLPVCVLKIFSILKKKKIRIDGHNSLHANDIKKIPINYDDFIIN